MDKVTMTLEDYYKMYDEIDKGLDEFVENIYEKYGVKITLHTGRVRWWFETDIEIE